MNVEDFIDIHYLKDVGSRAVERVFVAEHNNFVNANNHQRNVEENLEKRKKREKRQI